MPNPYPAYLVFGNVHNSDGSPSANATVEITTSISVITKTTDSDGILLFDLAEAGYVSGNTVIMDIEGKYNNNFKEHKFVVSGFFNQEDITLIQRTNAVNSTGYAPQSILHSVGKKPITLDNPLPVTQGNTQIFEERRANNASGQVEYIGEAIPGSQNGSPNWRIHKRTYSSNRLTKIAWAKYNAKFDKIWNDRITYNYR